MEKPNNRPENDGVVHLAQERKRRDAEQKRLEKAHRTAMEGKGVSKNVLIGSLIPILLILLILFQDHLMALFR